MIIIRIERESANDEFVILHNIKFESGEKVSKDDILFEVEGQKTAYDIVAPSDGFFYADPSLELEQEIEIDRIIGVISDEKTYDEKAIKSFLSKEIKKDKNNDNSDEHKFEDLELTNVKPHNFDQNKIRLAVIGGGAGLSQVLEITKHFEHFDLKGVYDDTLFNKELSVNGVPIIGSINIQNISNDFSDDLFDKIIISINSDIAFREKVFKELRENNLDFVNLIHPSVIIDDTSKIGVGNIILPNTNILSPTKIGNFNILGVNSNILHHCDIHSNCVIGGGTLVGSGTKIEKNVFIGVGTTISSNSPEKIKIGHNSFVCSGSVIFSDVLNNSKVIGNPARKIL